MPAAPATPSDAADVGRERLARALVLTVPAALLGVAAAVRVDAWLDLPGWGRGLLAVGWVVAVGLAGWRWAAFPTRPGAARFVPVVAALLAFLSLALAPAAGERVRRLFLPFYTPLPRVPCRLSVTSGEPAVARGSPVTLTAFAEPSNPGDPLPDSATLVVRDRPDGPERTHPMTGDGRGVFSVTLDDARTDFCYAVEADGIRTGWHAVTVVEPVGLADGNTIRLEPPNYARAGWPTRTIEGFTAFDVPQFGVAAFDLRFTRPAADAFFDWRPATGNRAHVPLVVSADRLSARVTLPVEQSGTLVLVLIAERSVRAEAPVAMRAVADEPPIFETATGLGPGPYDVAPDSTISGELGIRDDFGIAAARLEYEINGDGSKPTAEPLTLGGDERGLAGTFSLRLAGRVKVGDTVRVRVRATDNRSVPDRGLRPQEATYPPNGWATFRVTSDHPRPLAEQEILAQRDRIKRELAATVAVVERSSARVAAVAAEAAGSATLTVDQTARVTEAQADAGESARKLGEFASDLRVIPDLRPVASALQAATVPLRDAAERLRAAYVATTTADRDPALAVGTHRLREAVSRFNALAAGADRFAQVRLDRHALRLIAADLRELADRTPSSASAKEREQLVHRLAAVIAASPVLSAAADAAELDGIRATATQVSQLAASHERLTAAIAATAQGARDRALADLAGKQSDLAATTAEFDRRTEIATRLVDAAAVNPRPATDAVSLLKHDQTTEAAAEQEKAARELDRLADVFVKAADARSDTREAARQLARWQSDLRQRIADAGPLPDVDRERFKTEQRAIRDALARLALPPDLLALDVARATAIASASTAADSLTATSLTTADADLRKLAEQIPTREQRLKATRDAVEKLIREQDEIARTTDDPAKAMAVVGRQEALLRAVNGLDTPGLEHRRAAVADAAGLAIADLRAGYSFDIAVSQQLVRRQLVRLRQSADGTVPNDERAVDLARLQRSLADAADKLPAVPGPDELRPLRLLQQEIARQVQSLPAPEAAALIADAREAVYRADQASRGEPDDFRKQARAAEEALARLADRLTGAESDLARVQALMQKRIAAAEKAKLAPRTAPTPEEAALAHRLLDFDIDELAQVRTGASHWAKKRAAEALAKLRQAPDADRQPALQQAAADALTQLAEAMKRNDDRSVGHRLPAKPKLLDPAGIPGSRLPTRKDADEARELAHQQRELRDAVARTAAELARGVRPAPGNLQTTADDDDFPAQASRQFRERLDLIRRADELTTELDRATMRVRGARLPADADRLERAADALRRASTALAAAAREADAGRPTAADKLHRQAKAELADATTAAEGAVPSVPAEDVPARKALAAIRRAEKALQSTDAMNLQHAEEAIRDAIRQMSVTGSMPE